MRKTKKQYFNDLLLPIIFTLCILPFTVRLREYEYGYSKYAWHSDESVMQDIYTWYRMWLFLVIAALALVVLLFRMGLYKEKNKPVRVFLPFGIYLVFVALSCLFSINPSAAWLGNFVDLEGFFVLAGYGLVAFYTYQIMSEERDYSAVFRGMEISFAIMSVIGWMQIFGKDPLSFPFVQRLVMSEEYYDYYEGTMYSIFSGNNVSLSLYNPNYAVIYLIMFAAVFAVFLLFSKEKRQRIISGVLLLDALILTWFTYSRAGLVALAVVLVLGAVILIRKKAASAAKYVLGLIGGVAVLAAAFVAVDLLAFGGHYVNRLVDEKKDNGLKSILTTDEGVQINYGDDSYLLQVEGDSLIVRGTDGTECAVLTDAGDSYVLPIGTESEIDYFVIDGEKTIWVELYDNALTFTERDGEYIYETSWGKEDRMVEVAHADAGGLEYLGSGRVYIWTRIVPLLRKYILVGSGPDTFAEVYPQNDYAGKLVYAGTPARIIERAHNDYLMKWVQTGLLSVAALLAFYFLLLKKGFAYFGDGAWMCSTKNLLALGCLLGCVAYMVCGLFSDSTLYTSPVFYVFAGIVLSVAVSREK
jgi:O-antigen ligase